MLGFDWIVLLSGAALAFSVLNYVLLDGTDLGVGMLMGLRAARCNAGLWRCRYSPSGTPMNLAGTRRRRTTGLVSHGVCGPASSAVSPFYYHVHDADRARHGT